MKIRKRKLMYILGLTFMLSLIPRQAYAMHIAEGMLPVKWCVFWAVLCVPFFIHGLYKIKIKVESNSKAKLVLAMCGAYCFLLSALKLPSVTGSSSHPTGTGLGTIVFGPTVMTVLGVIVLLFQAILLAHGGLTTLGANTFSMAIVGPILGFAIYKTCNKLKVNKNISVFFTAAISDLATYIITSFQLAFVFHSESVTLFQAAGKFLTVFAITQIPLAIVEGILTVLVFNALKSLCEEDNIIDSNM